jgi:excinuclease ABC subunit A
MLSNQLGMELSQALYVLDEPTIGLHPRDNHRLIQIMKRLRDLGNTLVVVEHDDDVIKNSDYILEMGPGSGIYGGDVLFQGELGSFLNDTKSLTASYLRPGSYFTPIIRRPVDLKQHKYKIEILGASGHNLKKIDVTIPLNRFVVVSGVSGSGKSTLIRRILYPILANHFKIDFERPLEYKSVSGLDFLKGVVLLDQSPLSRNARSLPVTYLKIFDRIRDQFAATPMAKMLGCTSSTFSLNVEGGRCPVCKGTGYQEIDLIFMDNVILPCEECDGTRYKNEIKQVTLNGHTIIDVLNMTVDEAAKLFALDNQLHRAFNLLKEVGLGYLKLGQGSQTLSGGEAQRLKIARELLQSKQRQVLYILDEPTTGLHFREVDLLLQVLQRLVDSGASVVVIEHNTRFIKSADWVIELGPEGGHLGGRLLAQGPAEELIRSKKSVTGPFLA